MRTQLLGPVSLTICESAASSWMVHGPFECFFSVWGSDCGPSAKLSGARSIVNGQRPCSFAAEVQVDDESVSVVVFGDETKALIAVFRRCWLCEGRNDSRRFGSFKYWLA